MTTSPKNRTLDVRIQGTYTAWEIPPRCRNPRDVPHDTETTVQVPIVTAEEAPVVMRGLRSTALDSDGDEYGILRGWDGRLFERMRVNHVGDNSPIRVNGDGPANFETEIDARNAWGRGQGRTPAEFARIWQERYADTLIVEKEIDGQVVQQVWRESDEPRYVVHTLGLGHNHGGTDLSVTSMDNTNIRADRYFRIDDFDGAQAAAIEIAANRGDTGSVTRIKKMRPLFEIIDNAYVALVTPPHESPAVREARIALQHAIGDYESAMLNRDGSFDAAAEKKRWEALSAARADLLLLTDDPTGHKAEKRPYEERRRT